MHDETLKGSGKSNAGPAVKCPAKGCAPSSASLALAKTGRPLYIGGDGDR
jgi:hypothetical protein